MPYEIKIKDVDTFYEVTKKVKDMDENVMVKHFYAPAHMNRQRAGAVAVLGQKYLIEGKTESAAEHQPEYLRQSQAEREAKQKENDGQV